MVIGDKVDIILHFKAGMPSLFHDQVSHTYGTSAESKLPEHKQLTLFIHFRFDVGDGRVVGNMGKAEGLEGGYELVSRGLRLPNNDIQGRHQIVQSLQNGRVGG